MRRMERPRRIRRPSSRASGRALRSDSQEDQQVRIVVSAVRRIVYALLLVACGNDPAGQGIDAPSSHSVDGPPADATHADAAIDASTMVDASTMIDAPAMIDAATPDAAVTIDAATRDAGFAMSQHV